uniref:Nudix hydrolase domain-containing protein n=1 Tax=Kalanchoe fedtschenkoi TaxID=63787 RepID=A0A7N0TZJ3_KALFE
MGSEADEVVLSAELSVVEENGAEAIMALLRPKEDMFGGVVMEVGEAMEPVAFAALLKAAMRRFRQQEKNGIWLKLALTFSSLVDAAVKEGFKYHHAEPDYLMLVCWLPSRPCTLPANASHRVGIGAFVMNNQREVLVVQEKLGPLRGLNVWKFPTGAVDEGEDIASAAVREVKEETGINAEFVEVLAFRQGHKYFFGKSDLFFICMLKPLSFDIKLQESEIEAAKWLPIMEFVNQPFVQKHEQDKLIADICLKKMEGQYSGLSSIRVKSSTDRINTLFFNERT